MRDTADAARLSTTATNAFTSSGHNLLRLRLVFPVPVSCVMLRSPRQRRNAIRQVGIGTRSPPLLTDREELVPSEAGWRAPVQA